jgi:hypothetical protein
MTDALLAHSRTEGGVRTEHLERECARALADNFSLQSRLQGALARSRAAEEQFMMLHPYLLYGHGDMTKTHYPMAPTRMMTPNYFSSTGLSYRSPLNARSQQTLSVPTTGPTPTGPTLTSIPDSLPGSAMGGATQDTTAPRLKSDSTQTMSGTPTSSTVTENARTTNSLDYLISAARKVLDTTVLPEKCKKHKAEEAADSDGDIPAKTALDVLVAAAFADHRCNEIPMIHATAETEPSPRRSQRDRTKCRPTVSRSTPFISTDNGAEIQTPIENGRLSSQGRPCASTNRGGAEMKTWALTRSPALPAFMNFTPDYKNVPSTTTNPPAPATAPTYPRSPLLPFYTPPIPTFYTPAAGTSSQLNPLTSSSLSACTLTTPTSPPSGPGLSIAQPSEHSSQPPQQCEVATARRESSAPLSPSIMESEDPAKRQANVKRTRQDRDKSPLFDRAVSPEQPRWACLSDSTGEDEEDKGRLTKRRWAQCSDGDSPTANKSSANKTPVCGTFAFLFASLKH